jgi:uncharacterized repeat protein (TIGR03943 family)
MSLWPRINWRRPNAAAFLEALILFGTGVMLLSKVASGHLVYYVHPRYSPVVVACAAALLVLAFARAWAASAVREMTPEHSGPGGRLGVRRFALALPLLLAVAAPARPLGAEGINEAMIGRGLRGATTGPSASAPAAAGENRERAVAAVAPTAAPTRTPKAAVARRVGPRKSTPTPAAEAKSPRTRTQASADASARMRAAISAAHGGGAPPPANPPAARAEQPSAGALEETRSWDLLDWALSLEKHGDKLQGKPVSVIAFVYHPEPPLDEGFYATRHVIVHCVADAWVAGLPVEWPEGANIPSGAWVRVVGKLGTTTRAGQTLPAIRAEQVRPVNEPDSPYLYHRMMWE